MIKSVHVVEAVGFFVMPDTLKGVQPNKLFILSIIDISEKLIYNVALI